MCNFKSEIKGCKRIHEKNLIKLIIYIYSELSLQELIVQKVGILRVRLQTLQTTRQKLAEQVSSTQ